MITPTRLVAVCISRIVENAFLRTMYSDVPELATVPIRLHVLTQFSKVPHATEERVKNKRESQLHVLGARRRYSTVIAV